MSSPWLLMLLLTLAASGCAGRGEREADRPFTGGLARVESLSLVPVPGSAPQLRVIARGTLPDACTRIDGEEHERRGRRIAVTLTTRRESDASCATQARPFAKTIVIPVTGLLPGLYTLEVNGVSQMLDVSHADDDPDRGFELY